MNERDGGDQGGSPPGAVLVLSGGGSLGAFQVGILRSFYRGGFRPGAIVGTSVGAINGAFLAFHSEPDAVDRLRDIWLSLGANDIFHWNPVRLVRTYFRRRHCFFDNSALMQLFAAHLPADDFAAARLPFYAVATNLSRGVKRVFHEGSISRALLASSAIPALFCPIEIDGELYVDGGVVAGLDLETAIQLGARAILAVDLFSSAPTRVITDPFQIWRRSLALTSREQIRRELERFSGQANIAYISPPQLGVSPQDFRHAAELLDAGERHGQALAARLLDADGRLRPGHGSMNGMAA